jgi:hypothetical protein
MKFLGDDYLLGCWAIVLMMEAASTSGKSVNFYQTTRRNIPEDSYLQTRRREKLKSHQEISCPLCTP